MRLPEGAWVELEEVDSTQAQYERLLKEGAALPAAIRARHQTSGRGRHGRVWHDEPDASLIFSVAMPEHRGHPRPWLLGMSLACAAAGVLHCRLRWPNDLYLDGRKLGGILTEIYDGVPVLGIGINLNQAEFPPEIADRAISLIQHRPPAYDPARIGRLIWDRWARMPEIDDWPDLAPIWMLFDDTPGKHFRLPSGEEAIGVGIGPHGELMCSVEGEARTVLAADGQT